MYLIESRNNVAMYAKTLTSSTRIANEKIPRHSTYGKAVLGCKLLLTYLQGRKYMFGMHRDSWSCFQPDGCTSGTMHALYAHFGHFTVMCDCHRCLLVCSIGAPSNLPHCVQCTQCYRGIGENTPGFVLFFFIFFRTYGFLTTANKMK